LSRPKIFGLKSDENERVKKKGEVAGGGPPRQKGREGDDAASPFSKPFLSLPSI
jgi:hypothetical protein